MSNDESLAAAWRKWMIAQMEKHSEDAGSAVGQAVRYAADGIWLEACAQTRVSDAEARTAAVEYLIELTYSI
jgi:hypothetical protein